MILNNNITKTIKEIATIQSDAIFCGSISLVLNGLLKNRQINDIDILVSKDYYSNRYNWGMKLKRYIHHENYVEHDSHIFMIGKDEIKCFKVYLNDYKIDVFYDKNNEPEYDVIDFDGVDIKVEKPNKAIEVKKKYLLYNNNISAIKHLKDLIDVGVDKEEILSLIKKSIYLSDILSYYDDGDFDEYNLKDMELSDIALLLDKSKKINQIYDDSLDAYGVDEIDDLPF